MSDVPDGIALFCDDIRHEVGGKISLVGCYSGQINVSASPPLNLARFAVFMIVRIPLAYDFNALKVKLTAEFESEKETLMEFDVSKSNFVTAGPRTDSESDINRVHQFTSPVLLENLRLKGNGFIRARAYLGEVEIRLASLRINFEESQSGAMPNPATA